MSNESRPWASGAQLEVLGFLVRAGKVFLAVRTRKKGAGYLNGYGGGVHYRENLLDALEREIRVETGGVVIDKNSAVKVAIGEFTNHYLGKPKQVCTVHVYIVSNWIGDPISTGEMDAPEMWHLEMLPVRRMFPSDSYWVPMVLSGKCLRVWAEHTAGQKSLVQPPRIMEVTQASLGR